MRVLHTADVHLRTDTRRPVEALDRVLELAAAEGVDLVTIGGDLFDSPAAATELRGELRDRFEGNPVDVLAIPGNHDADVYRENLDFGRDLDVLVESPIAVRRYGDLAVVGVPYRDRLDDELYGALRSFEHPDGPSVLLIHCTLSLGFERDEAGEGEPGTYLPVRPETLGGLGFDVVLGGHIHSSLRVVPLPGGGRFVYPGSPVSHTTTERGRRQVALVDVDTGEVEGLDLDTFYHDRFERTLRPGAADEVLAEVASFVEERAGDRCALEVDLDGFIAGDETGFADRLEAAAGDAAVSNRVRSVAEVLEHPLYADFASRLDERDDLDDPEGVEDRFIEVLASALASREVRE